MKMMIAYSSFLSHNKCNMIKKKKRRIAKIIHNNVVVVVGVVVGGVVVGGGGGVIIMCPLFLIIKSSINCDGDDYILLISYQDK